MRLRAAIPFTLFFVLVACGGGAAPTATPGGPTVAPGQPTPSLPASSQPTAPPVGGGATVAVTLTGGTQAGSYSGSDDPSCAVGFMGAGIWSVNYVILTGSTAGTLSELILVFDPSNGGMTLSVGIGPLYDTANGFVEYEVTSHYAGHSDDGTGSVSLSDAGATATLQVSATTAAGVNIAATVNCPSIARG